MSTGLEDQNKEIGFLHNLSTPLNTALLFLEIAMDDVNSTQEQDPEKLQVQQDHLEKLQQAFDAVNKMKSLLEERRSLLYKE